jgi:hypothetical protein
MTLNSSELHEKRSALEMQSPPTFQEQQGPEPISEVPFTGLIHGNNFLDRFAVQVLGTK